MDVAKFNGDAAGAAGAAGTTAGAADLEAVKQEIIREMRKEVAKAKQEIIEGD